MSNWNFGGSGGGRGGTADPGLLDLKALLNHVTQQQQRVDAALGPMGPAVGSGNRSLQHGNRSSSSSIYGNHNNHGGGLGPIGSSGLGGLDGGGGLGGGGGSGGSNGSFFDPFSSMSNFGFFNPKDPGGATQSKSPSYGGNSPVFGANSPTPFFSNDNAAFASKFPISTFSIDDTIPGRENRQRERERETTSSAFADDSSSNGHNFPISHFVASTGNSSSANNYSSSRERDNFGSGNASNHHSSSSSNNRANEHGENSFNQGVRETGIIEKLLHSYGFIQCCERQARLFFHFSQFDGTIEHLKLGDPVEFEMTYDRRTGKPIASAVTKIGPEVVLSEERVTGCVTTELHHEQTNGEIQGRISYENRGECFFLPYCQEDIEGNVSLAVGDSVSFQIATNQRSGNLTARYVRLENPARPVRYRGIVSSLKDNFGFIERADVAKELFFQISETRITDSVTVNDNVEFNIQTRNGKEVACTITKLPFGTVAFEDIGLDVLKGQILKPIDKSQCSSPALGPTPRCEQAQGRLRYRGPDRQELEVVFGEKDQQGLFTMRHGDWVQFQLAIDRRNKTQRATSVTLLEESFSVSGERREEGVISAIKGDCGYISCAERDQKMFFRFTELLDFTRPPKIADDVEFTIIQDPSSPTRQSAIRVKYLQHGAVQFEIPVSQGLHGVVTQEPSTPWVSQEALVGILPSLTNLGLPDNVTARLIQSLSNNEVLAQLTGQNGGESAGEPGVIQYSASGMCANGTGWQRQTDSIQFHWKDCKHLRNIRVGTKVVFDIHQVRKNRELVAANIRADTTCATPDSPTNALLQQFVASSGNQANIFGAGADVGALVNSLLGNNGADSPTMSPNIPCSGNLLLGKESPDLYPNPEKDNCGSDFNLMRFPSSSSYDSNSDKNGLSLFRGSSVELEDLKCGRLSPSSSSDKSGFNGNYANESGSPPQSTVKTPRVVMKGFIAALKDSFGFIETMAQDGEIFFHSSSLVGDFTSLEVGQEVEYVVSSKASSSGKHAADIVKPLPKGSIGRAAVFPDILQGIVQRPLRGANPDQTEYTGLIDGQDGQSYPFGIISMLNKKELIQSGEAVEFQLDAHCKPVNIRAIRKKLRATVEAVKGQYGFLSYELEDGKKLFFHMSEVKDHQHLNPGDEVEFVILQNPRNGKSSACSVVKVGESQRPERLLNRLSKLSVDESAPRLIVVRQPLGPDGTRGFSQPRVPRKPGVLVSTNRDSTSSTGSQ